jgi:phage terminase large subunit-like protein
MATKKPKPLTRGERVIAFIERYCIVSEGDLIGKPIKLEKFQKQFLLDVYDNKAGTRRAYLSIARKNSKTATIACILLAHICGPEAVLNSRIISGAMSRDQAAEVYNYASKMIQLSPELSRVTRIVPSSKRIIGLARNVEYQAASADGRTAHGKSPVIAILDEVGQIRGPQSDFVDAIVTAQGAYENAMLFAISTQAPNDNDLFSIWLDDAKESKDPRIVSHVYEAPKECELLDRSGWYAANPALGIFRSLKDVEEQADRAARMPSFEPTFRNLVLNQRVEMAAPFISKGVWLLNSMEADDSVFYRQPVYVGLDLSAKNDLTAMVAIAFEEKWHVKPIFWTPEKGLRDRAKRDRAPYDIWADQGFIRALPSASIEYDAVAREIVEALDGMNIVCVAYDRWRFDLLKKEFDKLGVELPMQPFGQGFKDMAPAIDSLETILLNEKMAHSAHPVLTMCMANAKIEQDAAGNRKLNKQKATGRIDGAVALAMAVGVTPQTSTEGDFDGFLSNPVTFK